MKLADPVVLGATLKELLRIDGDHLIDDSAFLKARLADRAPHAKSEISLLVQTQLAGIPQALRDHSPTDSLRESLIRRLREELALSPQAANWAVDCWASAMGLQFVSGPPKAAISGPLKKETGKETTDTGARYPRVSRSRSRHSFGPVVFVLFLGLVVERSFVSRRRRTSLEPNLAPALDSSGGSV